jgi:integrase
MSVRKQQRTGSNGKVREFWIVDVKYKHKDGRIERVRKVPRRQTRVSAERLEREIYDKLEAGGFTKPMADMKLAPSFEEFSKEFVAVYAGINNKPSELASKIRILRLHLVPFFGADVLDEISTQMIDRYKAKKLRETYRKNKFFTAKSVNNHLAVLAKLLKTAEDWGICKIPLSVRLLKTVKPKIAFLGFEQADRLVASSHLPWLTSMIVLALNTGLRIGEILALQWADVDLVVGRLVVRRNLNDDGSVGTPKSGKNRELPLNDLAVAALRTLHRQSELVFPDVDGGLLTRMRAYGPLMTAMRKAGVVVKDARTGWHMLRHSFASHLVMRGVPLKVVQELLGHSGIDMTLRYAHLSPAVSRDAVNLLARGNLGATQSGSTWNSSMISAS